MLALDLCQAYNQVLLIIYLKFTAKCVQGIKQKKLNTQFYMAYKLHHKCNMCKKDDLHPLLGQLKRFQIYANFAMGILACVFCY